MLTLIDVKKSHLILLVFAILFSSIQSYNDNNYIILDAQGQIPQHQQQITSMQPTPHLPQPAVAVKITSPPTNQNVSTGNLTIIGTSSDTPTTECQVYADWNDKKPFQRAVAAGPEGNGDYSRWKFTYTSSYHEITNGTNELTSKISCIAGPTNLTKWYSINVTGIEGLNLQKNNFSASTNQVNVNNSDGYTNSEPSISRVTAAEIMVPKFDSYDSEESDAGTEDEDTETHDNDDKTSEDDETEDEETEDNEEDQLEEEQIEEDQLEEQEQQIEQQQIEEEEEEQVEEEEQ
ncbi:MAG: hypothetical protein M3297_15235, partial [Thermoproteota archaeon]|nr:hypothetical protein [Thermoproteota archaeon]